MTLAAYPLTRHVWEVHPVPDAAREAIRPDGEPLPPASRVQPVDEEAAWRAEAQGTIRTLVALEAALPLTPSERAGAARAVAGGFPLAITPHYLGLVDRDDPRCPIRLQCVPRAEEETEVPGDLRDPLGEEAHEVAPHLVQRYPDRALLLATDRCGVYCRFCTRSRMVGDGGGARSMEALAPAFAYLEKHPEVREVIVSGGDPALMSTSRLVTLLRRLASIDHVGNVRLATRVPVTLPQRVTPSFARALASAHSSLWVMTHFNHPKELCDASRRALANLVDAGLPVMNQTVLLRGVNDDAATLETLFRSLVRSRVRPYYLLQMDPVRGTSHLRTRLDVGVTIMERLQGRLSGIALPKLICDTPGGRGKVPLGPDVVAYRAPGRTTLRTFRGELVDYLDPPADSSDSALT